GCPQRVVRRYRGHAQPLLARLAVALPVQPRMVDEDLPPRPDDEEHEEDVEEVLPADPGRYARVGQRVRGQYLTGEARDEVLDGGHVAQALPDGDQDDESHEADGRHPQEVEPPAA